jgi:hypothetical protein
MLKEHVLRLKPVSCYVDHCSLILFDLAGFNER